MFQVILVSIPSLLGIIAVSVSSLTGLKAQVYIIVRIRGWGLGSKWAVVCSWNSISLPSQSPCFNLTCAFRRLHYVLSDFVCIMIWVNLSIDLCHPYLKWSWFRWICRLGYKHSFIHTYASGFKWAVLGNFQIRLPVKPPCLGLPVPALWNEWF